MFSTPYAPSASRGQQSAGAYHQVGTLSKVSLASPHGLVTLLFDGFFAAINRARGAMRSGDVAAKGRAVAHAVRIVDEGLKAALNLNAGGSLAADLNDLYAYVCLRLTRGNLQNDEAALDECQRLMQPLREAWIGIAQAVAHAAARN